MMNKATLVALLGLLSVTSTAASILEGTPKTDVKRGKFGALEITEYNEEGMTKTVHMPTKNYHRDYI